MIAILHSWGQTLTHYPHVHCIVPGGGLAPDGRWIACRPGFFLPVHVLSRLYRRLFLERLLDAFADGRLSFFGNLAVSIGIKSGPLIGVQKGPPLDRRREQAASARLHGAP